MSQQYNLANATITSNYVGKQALPYVAPAILAADTIANNYVTVLNNVRGRAQLRKFSGSQFMRLPAPSPRERLWLCPMWRSL